MFRLLRRSLLLLMLLSALAYWAWLQWQPASFFLTDLRSELAFSQGQDNGRGNLLGIQPQLASADYRSALHLHRKLAAHLEQAKQQGLLNDKTIVVLPEHIGTWLIASGERREVFDAYTLAATRQWFALRHPIDLFKALLANQGTSRLSDALMRIKAEQMAHEYQSLFAGLAESFSITLVAGSIVLPQPSIQDGVLHVSNGPLYNISVVFGPDGLPLGQPQRKILPHRSEDSFTAKSPAQELQVYATSAGRLAVLIGTDSWLPSAYERLNQQQAELIANPVFMQGNEHWHSHWSSTPSAVQSQHSSALMFNQKLTELLASSSAHTLISVFLRGQLWDLGSDGVSQVLTNDELHNVPTEPGAKLFNLWL